MALTAILQSPSHDHISTSPGPETVSIRKDSASVLPELDHTLGRDVLVAKCASCHATIGQFINRWRVTDLPPDYVCPAQLDSYRLTAVTRARGKSQQALSYDRTLSGTGIDACQIRDVRCSACRLSLGFVCVETPNSRRHYRDLECFQRNNILLIDESTGIVINPSIIREDTALAPVEPRRLDASAPLPLHDGSFHTAIHSGRLPLATDAVVPVSLKTSFVDKFCASVTPDSREIARPLAMSRPGAEATGPRAPADTWAGAISRLQTQVSYNTSMHESHRRQVGEIEQAVGRLQQEMGNVISVLNEFRAELRNRPNNTEPSRTDPGDLDLLVREMTAVTTKANEIDGIKMQIELLKNRMKRLEDGSPAVPHMRPRTNSTQREHYDSVKHAPPQPQLPPPQSQTQHHGPPLPPMRTHSSAPNASPRNDRGPSFYAPPPGPLPQSNVSIRPALEPRPHPADPMPQPPSAPGPLPAFREPIAPPANWRSAESFPPPGHLPAAPPSAPPSRPAIEPDGQPTSWAAVNANQPAKRPYDEPRPTAYETSSLPGSPKRPKLAPIMPRNNHPDENYAQQQQHHHHHHRHPHHPQPHPHASAPVHNVGPEGLYQHVDRPAQGDVGGSRGQNFRFVTTTSEGSEHWRSEQDRMSHHPEMMSPGRGNGRGGRILRGPSRARPRGRGGMIMHPGDTRDLAPHDWPGPHGSPNGFYQPVHPHSPRAGAMHRPPAPGEIPPGEYSVVPLHMHDGFSVQEAAFASGKKSRTKPFRNSEGVLIRKDGRPDMRSVSSANNLRRVHMKKEMERAGAEGRTSSLAPSITHANSNSQSEDEGRSRSGSPLSANGHGHHEVEHEHEPGHEHDEEDDDEDRGEKETGEDGQERQVRRSYADAREGPNGSHPDYSLNGFRPASGNPTQRRDTSERSLVHQDRPTDLDRVDSREEDTIDDEDSISVRPATSRVPKREDVEDALNDVPMRDASTEQHAEGRAVPLKTGRGRHERSPSQLASKPDRDVKLEHMPISEVEAEA